VSDKRRSVKLAAIGRGALLLLLIAAPAVAQTANLRGQWVGGLRCRSFNGTRSAPPKATATLSISQVGRYLAAEVQDSAGVRKYNGEVMRETGRASRFEAVLIECRSTSNMNNYSEVTNLKGFAVDDDGRLNGKSIFRSVRGEIGTCRWSFERISGKDPRIGFCQ